MKRRIGYPVVLVCGGVLLLWGVGDLWNWATTGHELLASYGEVASVVKLVEDTLTSAVGKLLVGAVCAAAGLLGMARERPGKSR